MFAILAAAGDCGAAIGPYITGAVADGAAGREFPQWFGRTYAAFSESTGMRTVLLKSPFFPLITLPVRLLFRRLHRRSNPPAQPKAAE